MRLSHLDHHDNAAMDAAPIAPDGHFRHEDTVPMKTSLRRLPVLHHAAAVPMRIMPAAGKSDTWKVAPVHKPACDNRTKRDARSRATDRAQRLRLLDEAAFEMLRYRL